MEIKEKTIKTYTFTEKEFRLIDQCLGYCNHRVIKHCEVGLLRAINFTDLQELRLEIKRLNN